MQTQNIGWNPANFDHQITEEYPVENVLIRISGTQLELPSLSIHTLKGTPLIGFWFEGVTGKFLQNEREKDAVMGLPRDYSMLTALRMYFEMHAAVMTYMREHKDRYVGVQMIDPE